MDSDSVKVNRAIDIMKSVAEGIDPFTGKPYAAELFTNDPRMVRCLYFIIDLLEEYKSGDYSWRNSRKDLPFVITQEEKSMVVLPEEKIGVNTFAKCINQVLDPVKSRKLTGVALNVQLKKMGILSEEQGRDGKRRTVLSGKSAEYGIESLEVNFNGAVYDKIVFNDKGKKFLLDNIEEIMSCK